MAEPTILRVGDDSPGALAVATSARIARFTTKWRQGSWGGASRSTIRVLGKSARQGSPGHCLKRPHRKTHLDVVLALWIGIRVVQIDLHARTVIRLIATSGQPVRHQRVPLCSV